MNEAFWLNFSFLRLRLHAVFRWIRPSVFQWQASEGRLWGTAETIGSGVTTFLLAGTLVVRGWQAGHFPVSSLFESLVFLSFLFSLGLFWLPSQKAPAWLLAVLGLAPVLVLGFASFVLPEGLREAGPLVPALKSNWLLRHVTVRIVAYAGLRLGSLLSVVYTAFFAAAPSRFSILEALDQWSYRRIGLGFPFLTLGILSGAVWAEQAWGSYWSWDPKETASLILWLLYAVYLHLRLQKGIQGQVPAQVGSFGFVACWICYLGVNLLGKGLHSYGFFSG